MIDDGFDEAGGAAIEHIQRGYGGQAAVSVKLNCVAETPVASFCGFEGEHPMCELTGRISLKKWYVVGLMVVCGAVSAQTISAKKSELVAKVLTLQQAAIEQTAQMLVERPAVQMMQQASVALQTRVPPEKRDAVAKDIQADLKKYADEAGPLVRQQAVKLAPSTIGVLMEQRFTEEELTQLIAILESPVNRKYQQMGGDLQKVLADKLVTETKASVEPKVKALEQAMVKHLGLPPPPAASAASAAKTPKK